MIPFIIVTWSIVGTIVGRILYRLRLENSARYTISKESIFSKEELLETLDHSSAITYGLWSIPLWPLTVAIWIVLAPTPQEKRAKRTKELENATKALEAVAKEYDLKIKV